MKKYMYAKYLFILLFLPFFGSHLLQAQVLDPYIFTQTAGTYTPITGGVVLFEQPFDDSTTTAIAIPSFYFAGAAHTNMFVHTNGYLTFGDAAPNWENNPLSTWDNYGGAVSAFGRNLASTATSDVRWQEIGSEVIVQWKDVQRYDWDPSSELISFQIRLNTTTGQIKVVYGGSIVPSNNPWMWNKSVEVGLRCATLSFPDNIQNRYIGFGGGSWSNSTEGADEYAGMYFHEDSPTTIPTAGLTFTWTLPPPCAGIPNAGNAQVNVSTICAGSYINLTITGDTPALSLAYQWQVFDGIAFVDVPTATKRKLTALPANATQYRCKVTCTTASTVSYTTPVNITFTAPIYAAIPYVQDFENTWSSSCSIAPFTESIPETNWRNIPASGDNSWRKSDMTWTDLGGSGWNSTYTSVNFSGAEGSTRSARFHSYGTPLGTKGSLDLYLNLSSAGQKTLMFDYINNDGADIVEVLLSHDGGATFTLLPTALGISPDWTNVSYVINSTSPTAVIRIRATSDGYDGTNDDTAGQSDIGIDNVGVYPPCAGTPNAGTINIADLMICAPTKLKLVGASVGPGITYQWQSSTTSATTGFAPAATATSATYTPAIPAMGTWYRCVLTCANGGETATSTVGKLTPFTTISTFPYTENFDGIVTTNEVGTQPEPPQAINPTNSALPCGWLVSNNNADNFTWKNANLNAASQPNALAYNYNWNDITTAADDWVFSPPLTMVAGKNYTVSFKYRTQSSTYIEDLEVSWGTAQNATGMPAANQIANIVGATNTSYETHTCTAFILATAGVHYIGFHAKSAPNQWNLYIDDLEITETCPTATFGVLLDGVLGTNYNQTLTQTGFVTDVAWTITNGNLPTGLSLNSGAITGTPTATGAYTFTIKAEASGCSSENTYTVNINCPTSGVFAPATTAALPTALPQSIVNVAYTTTIAQSTLTGAVTWSATGLPAGLTIDANTGVISGTATALTNTPANITITATAPAPNTTCSLSADYTLNVVCSSIIIAPATLPNGVANTLYTQTLSQTGIVGGEIVWSIASGTLPIGLILNASTGIISGTLVAGGTSNNLTFSVTNGICTQTTSTYTLVVDKAAQTITFGALSNKVYGDASFTLGATATSNLSVTYSSSNLDVVTLAGNTATIVGAGTAVITASQAGNAVYLAATDVPQTFNVTKANQTLTFGTLINKTFGDAPFNLSATASSTLPASYTSSNTAVATISGNTVTIIGAGVTTITASQAGNGNYNAGTDVLQTLTVLKANQTITFAGLAGKTFGDVPFNPSATASSGLSISYVSSNTAVATVSGNLVTIVGVGTTTLTASQAGNSNYSVANNIDQTLNVGKANQTITFAAITDKVVNDAPFNLNATSSVGLPITYSISTVPTTNVATLSGNIVTIVGVGSVTITTSQVGNTNYSVASNVSRTFAINLPTSLLPAVITSEVVTYPNPNTSGIFQVRLGKLAKEEVSYQVFDAQGKSVQTGVWKDQEISTLTLTTLANGTYTLHLRTNKGTTVQRLVINK